MNYQKYDNLLSNVHHTLSFTDPLDLSRPPADVQRIRQSNHCLEWLYTTHLKGKYEFHEVESILGLVKHVLLPRLQSLQNPDELTYTDMTTILRGVLRTFTRS